MVNKINQRTCPPGAAFEREEIVNQVHKMRFWKTGVLSECITSKAKGLEQLLVVG